MRENIKENFCEKILKRTHERKVLKRTYERKVLKRTYERKVLKRTYERRNGTNFPCQKGGGLRVERMGGGAG